MRCLICGDTPEPGKGWQHLNKRHLEPYGIKPENIWIRARELAYPLAVYPAPVTFIKPEENCLYFSVENAALLMAYAREHADISWERVLVWLVLHEQGHLTLREKYALPDSCLPYVQLNAEDYYINKFLISSEYWQVCLLNARCAVEIRNAVPLPYEMRDGYFYCTLATFLAYDAVTLEGVTFAKPAEGQLAKVLAGLFRKLKDIQDLPKVCQEISEVFPRLYPPPGVSWERWEIFPQELRGREISPEKNP